MQTAAPSRPSALAPGLVVGALACLSLVALGFARFPNWSGGASGAPIPAALVTAVALVPILAGVSLARAQVARRDAARRYGPPLDLIVGVIWVAYILTTHLLIRTASKPTVGALITDATMVFTAVLVVAVGAFAAWRTGRLRVAVAVGWWAGLIAAMISMITLLLLLDLSMSYLVTQMNSGELQAYAASSWVDRQDWFYWQEELVGSAGNFLYLLVFGVVAGTLGGLLGAALHRTVQPFGSLRRHGQRLGHKVEGLDMGGPYD